MGADGSESRSPLVRSAVSVALLAMAALAGWSVLLFRYRYWIATNDHAIFQLALEEMADGTIPLIGPYSRLDFRHPGPIREWLFFVPYQLSGGRSAALPATTVVFHASMFAVSIRAGWQWMRLRGATTAVVAVAIMYAAIGKELAEPWNPYLATTAMFAAMWGLLAFLHGGGWFQAVVCASFAAQMHAPAVPLAVALVGIVVAIAVLRRRAARLTATSDPAGPRQPSTATTAASVAAVTASVGAVIVLWIGPVLDAFGPNSNLRAGIDASRTGTPAGLANALAFAGRVVDPSSLADGTFLRGSAAGLAGDGGLVPLLAWLAVGTAVFGLVSRRGDRAAQIDLGVMALMGAAAVATMSRFVPEFYGHLFGTITAVAVVSMTATVAIGVGTLWSGRVPISGAQQPRLVTAIGVVVVLIGTAVGGRELHPNVAERRALAVVGAVDAHVVDGSDYAVVAGGNVGAIIEGEVALIIERSGGEALSDMFHLALPDDPGDVPVFVVAMTSVRQCVLDAAVGDVVLDGVVAAVLEPISVVLVDPADRATIAPCLPR